MRELAVVVLAAGQGTRMKSATPKVLHEIAGIPILGHVLATAHSLEANKVLAVLRHEKQLIEAYVQSHFPNTDVVTQDEIPGTGRAAEQALEALDDFDGDVLILSGDVPLLDVESISQLVQNHQQLGSQGSMISVVLENPNGYGRILRAKNSDLQGIVEQKDASAAQLEITEVNAGVYVFDAKALRSALSQVGMDNAQGEKYLTDVVGLMLASGQKVHAQQILDPYLVAGINDRAQLSEIAKELNARIVRAWQLAGVTVQEPHSTWIDVTVQLGQDVTLLPSTRLHGLTRVGVGAVIGPDTTLRDVEVGENAKISRTQGDSARVLDGATVGPFAYLRPGTELGADGKIGAFVETKNAKIGRGAKVPHLSYVGDATIGEGANIGAGTIFANYDGVNKHRTEVGPHARTGSGNVFVAPVSIGAGAYTAAGSTIRRNVEPGALALNPSPQKNMAGWVLEQRPGSA
ncbi:MAG TPA: bifunctional UDP-N-acetylglucosamine diphosphorylase/glucosamine-1-phosphate N-acetyltransferase GlmU, partial [Aquiluna sp.]